MTDTAPPKTRAKPVLLNSRSLAWLRGLDYQAEVVEQNMSFPRKGGAPIVFKRDFMGGIDLIAVRVDSEVRFVQVTTRSNGAARRDKLAALPAVRVLAQVGVVECHLWSKRGKRGERKLWRLNRWWMDANGAWTDLGVEPEAPPPPAA